MITIEWNVIPTNLWADEMTKPDYNRMTVFLTEIFLIEIKLKKI